MPESFRLGSEPYAKGWRSVKELDGFGLHRKILEAGWTFFFLAWEVKATGFGFEGEEAKRRAIRRILAKLKYGRFNCAEITEVAAKHFLMLHCVTLSAHPRHIQESMSLSATPYALENAAESSQPLFQPKCREAHEGEEYVGKKWRQSEVWPGTAAQGSPAEAHSRIAKDAGNQTTSAGSP